MALDIRDQQQELWIWDLARQTLTRLTDAPAFDQNPVWTPDSRRIIFSSGRAGVPNLYAQAANNTGTVERLTTSPNVQAPLSISPDGTRLAYQSNESGRFEISVRPFPDVAAGHWTISTSGGTRPLGAARSCSISTAPAR